MSALPLVSILIPAYNAERWLAEAVASARGQTYPNVEVVVVDDGSADGSVEVARSFEGRGVRVYEQANAGACAARNAALERSRGDYVKFLDADDVLLPGAVAAQLAALGGEPGDVTSFGMAVRCDAALRPLRGRSPSTDPEGQLASERLAERLAWMLERNIQTSRPLHPRRLLEQVNGFDTRLERGQEYDMHMRMAIAGVRFKFVPEVGVLNRDHSGAHRITNKRRRSVSYSRDWWTEVYHLFGGEYPKPVKEARARSLWSRLIQDVYRGDMDSARSNAEEAVAIDPSFAFNGSEFRRHLYRRLGPVRAETAIREVKKRMPNKVVNYIK